MMSENENRTLFLDILRPYRKAVSLNSPKPSVSSAATKLNFNDSSLGDGFGNSKRKTSFDSDSTPKRTKGDSESNGNTPVPSSPWEVRRLKGEIIELKAQITRLEAQLSQQHNVRKEMEVLFDTERRALTEEKKSRERAANEMADRLKVIRERETQLKDQIAKLTQKNTEATLASEKEQQQLSKEISELRVKIIEATYAGSGQVSEMKKDMEELAQALEAAQKEVEHYKIGHNKAAQEAEKAAKLQMELDVQALTLKKTEQKLRELETDKETYNQWLLQAKASQKRLAAMPVLEREVTNLRSELRSLRSTAHQCQLLEEQVHVLETKLASLEPVHQNLELIQIKCSEAEKELEEWRSFAVRFDATTPSVISDMIEKLQDRDVNLTTQKVEADSLLAKAKDDLITALHEKEKATTRLTDLQNIQRTQQSLIHRIQKKLLLVSRERDSYRHQLDCYEKELTVSLSGEHHGGGGVAVGLAPLNTARIDALEKSLQGYRDLVAKMEQDMSVMKADVSPTIQDQISRFKDEITNLKIDNEKLRGRKNELEIQLEQYAIKESENIKTKLVHMTQNPFSMLQDNFKLELDKAHAEIVLLRKKLEANELELTQKLSESMRTPPTPSHDIQQLKNELDSNKLIMKRLKEAFASSIDEYRNAFYMLLGYTLDRTSPNNYKLTNVYAESENDYLAFKITGDGQIEMISTDYASQINDLVELHLHKQKSIPVFLSSLTINLYNRTTMCQDSTLQATNLQ